MTDQPEGQKPESSNSVTNVSGGVNANAERIDIGGDAVGRDKIVHIDHYYAGGETASSKPKIYHNLPQPDYAHFVGRERELTWLRERLSPKDRAWQIAITGIGGVGKSALALTIAREYLEHFAELSPDQCFQAIIWVSAKEEVLTVQGRDQAAPSGLILKSLEDVYAAIAQTLDREDITRAASAREQDRLVQKVLGEFRTLLVMDNLESVTDERIKPFLRYLPGQTKAVITSREWVEVADVLPLRGLTAEEAEQLLIDEAAVRNVVLSVMQRRRLVDLTSGLPLPLKLSVARIASGENFEAVTRWLGNAVGDVPEYCVQGQAELAHQRDPNAWSLLLAVSLFDRDAGAAPEALGQIVDLSIADRDTGLAQLQRLFLVNHTESDRFWALPIVQRYAAAQLDLLDATALIERWLTWLVTFGQAHGADLEIHIEKASLVGAEYPNLLYAIRWCNIHQRWSTLLNLSESIWFYPYLAGRFSEMAEILEMSIGVAEEVGDERTQARMQRRLGRLERTRGHYEDALMHLSKAEDIARRTGDEIELGRALDLRTDVLWYLGREEEAEKLSAQVLEIGEHLDSLELKALSGLRLAKYEIARRHFEEAMLWLDRAEQWTLALGSTRRLAWVYYRRGVCLIEQDNLKDAEVCLLRSLDLTSISGERRVEGSIKIRLAKVYAGTKRFQLASQAAKEGLDLLTRLGVSYGDAAEAEQLIKQITLAAQDQI